MWVNTLVVSLAMTEHLILGKPVGKQPFLRYTGAVKIFFPFFMKRITIVGAGAVGAHIASAGILKDLPAEFLLLDLNEDLEAAQVLDLRDSLLFSDTKGISGADFGSKEVQESDIFIITAGSAQKEGESRTNLLGRNEKILRSIADGIGKMKETAVVMMVTNPVDILTELAQDIFGLPRGQVLGTGTLLDSSRMKWHIAEKCGVHPKNVAGFVLGEHGDSEFIAWSQVMVRGRRVQDLLSTEERDEIEQQTQREAYEIIKRKGATFFGIGAATIKIVSAILGDRKDIFPVSASLNGGFGISGVALGIPCVIGERGIEQIWEIPLEAAEQEKLKKSAEKLQGFLTEYRK
ncbi:MAG: L-lactate dehydrogenase [Candidatus Peregrinibacteria bacterium]